MAVEQSRGMSGGALTRKVGPLPVWGWAVGLLVGYFLYQRYKSSAAANTSSTAGTSTDTTGTGADMNPVPVGTPNTDSGLGGGYGGGPTTIYNYYGSNPADTGGTGAGSSPPPQGFTGGVIPVQSGGGQMTPGGGTATFGPNPPGVGQIPGPRRVDIWMPPNLTAAPIKVSGGRLTQ